MAERYRTTASYQGRSGPKLLGLCSSYDEGDTVRIGQRAFTVVRARLGPGPEHDPHGTQELVLREVPPNG